VLHIARFPCKIFEQLFTVHFSFYNVQKWKPRARALGEASATPFYLALQFSEVVKERDPLSNGRNLADRACLLEQYCLFSGGEFAMSTSHAFCPLFLFLDLIDSCSYLIFRILSSLKIEKSIVDRRTS